MRQFLDLKTLARIKELPLVAKTVAEGFLMGLQPSMQRGVGIEFSQYRAYQEGDPLNRIDWKLFARSDRYYVREAERESEIDIWFLLDTSNSMLQQSQDDHSAIGWNKITYAKYLIASLSYLANKQGDSFGLMSLNQPSKNHSGEPFSFVPTGNGEKHWQKLLIELTKIKVSGAFPPVSSLISQLERLQRPSLIFVVSDFYQSNQEITDFLGKLNSSSSEVVALQLMSIDELEFNFEGAIRFKELESKQEILLSAEKTKQDYLSSLRKFQQQLQSQLAKKNIGLQTLNIDHPLDTAMFEYLKHRQRLV